MVAPGGDPARRLTPSFFLHSRRGRQCPDLSRPIAALGPRPTILWFADAKASGRASAPRYNRRDSGAIHQRNTQNSTARAVLSWRLWHGGDHRVRDVPATQCPGRGNRIIGTVRHHELVECSPCFDLAEDVSRCAENRLLRNESLPPGLPGQGKILQRKTQSAAKPIARLARHAAREAWKEAEREQRQIRSAGADLGGERSSNPDLYSARLSGEDYGFSTHGPVCEIFLAGTQMEAIGARWAGD